MEGETVWVEGTVTTGTGARELVGDNCSSESRQIREGEDFGGRGLYGGSGEQFEECAGAPGREELAV